jgi:hypothetical protein
VLRDLEDCRCLCAFFVRPLHPSFDAYKEYEYHVKRKCDVSKLKLPTDSIKQSTIQLGIN